MTEEELSRDAMAERSPDTVFSYDWLAWYRLRDVYRDFRAGKITKETGEAIKNTVMKDRRKHIAEVEMRQTASRQLAEFWKEIQMTGVEYMKDPTIEHADRFVEAVYGTSRLKKEE